ncbi:hypothetical protein FOXG_15486 [Fusarium oxysporum f. sp. lycopersici 4287]|uniref:Uncharacterized protein n=1 Tax=Fusarium oxysporum f. sp. lycopersici (strain 4287 / CBS 123668 / FGSC 9935 / NRRL 34936) TaxID=426428 RepID=A0A0J9W4B2_FUSO4|nr:hypothetical protein FOXG_15486 [Fusarium oxysporum f. sp. lycopersici 4287]KNB17715.1 hypothetical protein FOXG_15486 [Fusarium oxysporum f. sp. lycopersici 4287]
MAVISSAEKDVSRSGDAVEHHEVAGDGHQPPKELSSEAADRGQGISGYEGLTPWETIKKFKMNAAVCFAVTLSAATDGYQIGYVFHITPTLLALVLLRTATNARLAQTHRKHHCKLGFRRAVRYSAHRGGCCPGVVCSECVELYRIRRSSRRNGNIAFPLGQVWQKSSHVLVMVPSRHQRHTRVCC